jgi:hypothetical protein
MLCSAMWMILIQQSWLFLGSFKYGSLLSSGLQRKWSTNQNLTSVTSTVQGYHILDMFFFVDPYVQMVPN